jgi:hypothetical protein
MATLIMRKFKNINMVTKNTGHLNHAEANKSTLLKTLAILISEKIVPEIVEIRDKPSANRPKVNQPSDDPATAWAAMGVHFKTRPFIRPAADPADDLDVSGVGQLPMDLEDYMQQENLSGLIELEQWEIAAGVWLDKDGNPNVGYQGD